MKEPYPIIIHEIIKNGTTEIPQQIETEKMVLEMSVTIGALFTGQIDHDADRKAAIRDLSKSATQLLERGDLPTVGRQIGIMVDSKDADQRKVGIGMFAALYDQTPVEARGRLPDQLGLEFSRKPKKA